ncbi:hypothetical protein [Streptococcus zalophi]|uniref:Uncharacterized protein n=1 Tax=Streptococcus zalophi TaxID=640031 RepID=A0A934P9L3_9STRE|nr:hypothetical protein [Streptococcus zalophi]MBJ8349492.1 hypothetical protein [Streptococcus zalophi]
MNPMLLLVPVGIVIIGIVVMISLNARAKNSNGLAQNVMKDYVLEQVPSFRNTEFNVLNILDDAINTQHIWVVAYNKDGMFLIPSLSNPLSRTIKRYENLTPVFDLKKQVATKMFSGSSSEELDYIPFSAITETTIDKDKQKISIRVGDTTKRFKYQNKDCFGAEQSAVVESFLSTLEAVGSM